MVKWIKFENFSKINDYNSHYFCQLPDLQNELNPCYVARAHLSKKKIALGYVTQIQGSTKFYFNYYKDNESHYEQFTKEILTRDPATEMLIWSPIVDCKLPLTALPAGCENGRQTYICIRRKATGSVQFCQKSFLSLQKSMNSSLEVLCLAGHNFQVNSEWKQKHRSFTETQKCCIIILLFVALLLLYIFVYILLMEFEVWRQ